MEIKNISDLSFKKYGKIIKDIDFQNFVEVLNSQTPSPENVVYEPSVAVLEQTEVFNELRDKFGGELEIQIGYCNGKNSMLNALEYHKTSEINIAGTDAVIFVGVKQDITEEMTYDTSWAEAFLIPKGTAVELYATTLHYAPCNSEEEGFKMGIVLLKGTNLPLEKKHDTNDLHEDRLIAAKNKWLIGHPDANFPEGTYLGLLGKNLSLK